MSKNELILLLGQAGKEETNRIFEDFVRGAARYAVLEAMEEELVLLCGDKHRPTKGLYRRSGSSKGKIYIGNRSENIKRPRVRKQIASKEQEYRLKTYAAARSGDGLKEAILAALVAGVSNRKQQRINPATTRVSKSEVSRLWKKKSIEYIEHLRNRPLDKKGYLALSIDGLHLCEDITAIAAMGITEDGTKHMLDFEIGSSENSTVCQSLAERLVERGFKPAGKHLLAVLDGSKALKKAVLSQWPDVVIQTCLVHVERTIRGRIAKKYYGVVTRLFNAVRKAANLEAALEAYKNLSAFIKKNTAAGFESLKQAEPFMLTVHQLGIPDTLNKTFLSTNIIENSIRNMRCVIGRITRWKTETDMASRWVACAMIEAEKGMRLISGYKDLDKLKTALCQELAPHGGHIPLLLLDQSRKVA